MIIPEDQKTESSLPNLPILAGENPPAYTPRNLNPEASGSRPPRLNLVYIQEKHSPVEGEWTIDPNVAVPPALMPVISSGEAIYNARLVSEHRPVTAKLNLISDAPCTCRILAQSKHKLVTVVILQRINQSIQLTANSKHGGATVYLPRDFQGPITTIGSKLEFSPAVQQCVTVFSKKDGVGRAFMGRWDVRDVEKDWSLES
ncbi:hypothetical protein FRB99_007926, partial [Tulasnella sp. 403]